MIGTVVIIAAILAAPCPEAVSLTAGQPAPCDGDLVPRPALVQLLQDQSALSLVKERMRVAATIHETEIRACQSHWDAERASRLVCEREKSPAPLRAPWYEHPAFVATTSVILTAGVCIGIAYAVK